MLSQFRKSPNKIRTRFTRVRFLLLFGYLILWIGWPQIAKAQRPSFGDSFVIPQGQVAPPVIGISPGTVPPQMPPTLPQMPPQGVYPQTVPPPPLVPMPQATPAPSLIQPPTYAPNVNGTTTLPPIVPSVPQQSTQPPSFIYPPPPGTVPPITPSWTENVAEWPSQAWAGLQTSGVYQCVERPRLRQTFITRNGTRGLGLTAIELATTLNLPNFAGTTQALRFTPGFNFNWWNGPRTPETGADMPPRTYGTYLAMDYSTPWNRPYGGEINFTVGLYTDFNEVTSDSVRFTGVALGWFKLNPTTTFKLGIEYFDRVDIKLLPAGGLFIYPNPNLKFDLYFPRPRIATRFNNVSGRQVWGYFGGEYGGGSWTYKRITGVGDQGDVNDITLFLGVEWMGPQQSSGLFEVGYVFDREIVYRSDPTNRISIGDGVMFRAGIAF